MLDPFREGKVFGIGGRIGDPRPEKGRETAGIAHLGGELGESGAREDDDGAIHRFRHLPGRRQAMVHQGKSVEHRPPRTPALLDALLGILKPEIAGVGVRRIRQQIGASPILQTPEQFDVVFDQGDTAAGLHQGAPFFLGVYDRQGVIPLEGNRLKVCGGFFQVHLPAGRPEGQDLFPSPVKNSASDQR